MQTTTYHLVHVISSGEYKTPLVASQVFDRAQAQATIAGPMKPASVSVWIIAPMREVFAKDSKEVISALRKRCPDVNIAIAGGISRLNNWPLKGKLNGLRNRLKGTTVYHCRGESSFEAAYQVKQQYPGDAVVVDIRGYWPLERVVNSNVFNLNEMSADQKKVFDDDAARLRNAVTKAEWMCTVSEPLRRYLVDNAGARADSIVIPCCVQQVIPGNSRDRIRQELNLAGKTAILYLGGIQKYQHLDDLVMPFLRSALAQSEKYVAVLITQNKEKMAEILTKFNIDESRVRLISLPQTKVGEYLTAMDLGLLLRAPSELNNFSQPVKFGEYLSAGVPVVLEEGTGNISEMLDTYKIGCVIKLSGKKNGDFDAETGKALKWYDDHHDKVRSTTTTFVDQYYNWASNVQKERKMYSNALQSSGR